MSSSQPQLDQVPLPAKHLSAEAVLDSLKMILFGATPMALPFRRANSYGLAVCTVLHMP